jgi:hypothetical protein
VAQNECYEFLLEYDHEALQVCGSSRSNGSLSAFCGWGNGSAGAHNVDFAHLALKTIGLNSEYCCVHSFQSICFRKLVHRFVNAYVVDIPGSPGVRKAKSISTTADDDPPSRFLAMKRFAKFW